MRLTALVSISLLAFFLMGTAAIAKPEKVEIAGLPEAKELLEVMGIGSRGYDKVMKAMSMQLVEVMSRQYPGKGKEVNDIMKHVMKSILDEREDEKDKMIVKTATIYAAHFSPEELTEMTSFYRTKVGRKLSVKLPVIAMETMKSSRAWAQEVAGDIVVRFDKEARKRGLKNSSMDAGQKK